MALPGIHPQTLLFGNLNLWRDAYKGGPEFVKQYLQKFSTRETNEDFTSRKLMTYCPRFAGEAIDEYINFFTIHLGGVIRQGGPSSYISAMRGENKGVDNNKSNMNYFLSKFILPELFIAGKVGVFIDKETRPYLYCYRTEDIINWVEANDGTLTRVLLRDYNYDYNADGYPTGLSEKYRELIKESDSEVRVKIMDTTGKLQKEMVLNLSTIPFVVHELPNSLMRDIADYQVALLNLESSDISFLIKANFPFYIQQQGRFEPDNTPAPSEEGDGVKILTVGVTKGVSYPSGADAPSFIAPPVESIRISLEKQEQIKKSIRQLLKLNISTLSIKSVSDSSKDKDIRSFEAGLKTIAESLEKFENEISQIWAEYESAEAARVSYPSEFDIDSLSERQTKVDFLMNLVTSVPSLDYQKAVLKQIIDLTVPNSTAYKEREKMKKTIDSLTSIYVDPDSLLKDLEAGGLSRETYSILRGYTKEEAKKAHDEHVQRLREIKMSQAPGEGTGAAVDGNIIPNAARGVPDNSANPKLDGKVGANKKVNPK